jgi:hypothetical protein
MSRIAFSILFPILILVLAWGARAARKSGKDIGVLVSFLLITLIPPVLGNWMIIIARHRWLALAGSYFYFIGMDCAVFSLWHFTHAYCDMGKPKRGFTVLIYTLFGLDILHYVLDPVINLSFDIESTLVDGRTYFRLIPYIGQNYHRVVCYGLFFATLVIFFVKAVRASRVYAEKYWIILL